MKIHGFVLLVFVKNVDFLLSLWYLKIGISQIHLLHFRSRANVYSVL
jgi:hypothetical protein